jgi:RNA recognition motif-containing protein
MANKIYVGNLNYETTEHELSDLFSQYGSVESVAIITDKFSGRSKGFGFVEMDDAENTSAAIAALNGTVLGNRTLRVNEANSQKPRF